jgi:hypothetical protein
MLAIPSNRGNYVCERKQIEESLAFFLFSQKEIRRIEATGTPGHAAGDLF